MQQNKLIMGVLILVILVGIAGMVYYLKGGGDGATSPSTAELGVGMPTSMVVFDDGSKVPLGPGLKSDPKEPSAYTMPGRAGKGYMEYRCVTTGKTWPYGKGGQINSPYVGPGKKN